MKKRKLYWYHAEEKANKGSFWLSFLEAEAYNKREIKEVIKKKGYTPNNWTIAKIT